MRYRTPLFVAALVLPFMQVFADEVRYIDYDSQGVTSTIASGPQGSDETIKEPGRHAWLYGMTFDETGDQPCYIEANWWRHTDENIRQDFTTRFNVCKGSPKGDKSVILPDAVADRVVVTALQVCTNKKKNSRLKGAKIWGGHIDRNGSGSVTDAGVSRSFERTNCGDWRKKRDCPSGTAAVGFRIEYNSDEVVGIALRCAEPEIRKVQAPTNAKYADMEQDIRVETDKDGDTTTMTITQAIDHHKVAGATVVVVDGGAVDIVRHYGLRDFNDNKPTNGNTLYQAASISKFVAALGMAKAARTTGPKLGRRVNKMAAAHPDSLLDDWQRRKFNKDEDAYPSDISVRRLLSHSAGLSQHGISTSTRDCYTEMRNILMGEVTCARTGTKPIHPPGTVYDYSGGGYTVAEHMLELATGRSAVAWLNDEVLSDYGMSRSTFDTASKDMDELARGCSRSPCLWDVKHTQVKFAGGLLAHPEDYGELLALVINDGRDPPGREVIPFADFEAVMTPGWHKDSSLAACTSDGQCSGSERCLTGKCRTPLDAGGGRWYGLGVKLSQDMHGGFPRFLSHGGAQDGFRNEFWLDRRDRVGVVIFVNGDAEWSKNGVTYGGGALADQILAAFKRHY